MIPTKVKKQLKYFIMAIINWRKTICFFLMIMFTSLCFSQSSKPTDFIKVRLSIVGQGLGYGLDKNTANNECFFALATITNLQDTAIKIIFPDCAWPYISWVTSTEKVFLNFTGCDAQQMKFITLIPNQTIEFNIALSFKDKKSKVDSVKIGFNYDCVSLNNIDRKNPKQLIFWSNEVKLENTLNTFKIQEF
jgi:hypothetical protein